jgi:hypothetical protein
MFSSHLPFFVLHNLIEVTGFCRRHPAGTLRLSFGRRYLVGTQTANSTTMHLTEETILPEFRRNHDNHFA